MTALHSLVLLTKPESKHYNIWNKFTNHCDQPLARCGCNPLILWLFYSCTLPTIFGTLNKYFHFMGSLQEVFKWMRYVEVPFVCLSAITGQDLIEFGIEILDKQKSSFVEFQLPSSNSTYGSNWIPPVLSRGSKHILGIGGVCIVWTVSDRTSNRSAFKSLYVWDRYFNRRYGRICIRSAFLVHLLKWLKCPLTFRRTLKFPFSGWISAAGHSGASNFGKKKQCIGFEVLKSSWRVLFSAI
jgi:hypothetical protein